MEVLIADDHPLMLAGLRKALAVEGFDVVAQAGSGQEVLALVARLAPDLVVLDLQMPGMDGLWCLDRIVTGYPETKVVVWSDEAEPELIEASFKRGAHAYLVKSINLVDLASAIRQAVEGTAYLAHGLPALREEGIANAVGLTEREVTIVKLVACGLSNQAIARELWVTEQTVKFHLTNVYRKLEVANRTEAARWAFAHGLVTEGWRVATVEPVFAG